MQFATVFLILVYKYEYFSFCVFNGLIAQSCVISPSINSLTIRNRLQRDIELHCQCVDVKGIPLTGAQWFSGNNLILARSGQSDNRNPYYIDDVPSRLIIASGTFMGSLATTYTCGLSDTAPPRDTITLFDGGSEYIVIIYVLCSM